VVTPKPVEFSPASCSPSLALSWRAVRSQACATTEQQLAVWFEPPATGTAAAAVARLDLHFIQRDAEPPAAIWPTTVNDAGAISCAASWTRARPSEDSCTRAVAAPICVG